MQSRMWRARAAALMAGFVLVTVPAYAGTNGNIAGYRAVTGDFNGDGWTDILLQPLPSEHGTTEFVAYSDGNFGPPTARWHDKSRGTDWNAGAHHLVVGDFNGDGRDDVLLQGVAGLPSQVALARRGGQFPSADATLPNTLGGLDVSAASHHLVSGDFNGDGRDDLLLQANTFVGTNGVALAGATGEFKTLASQWKDGFSGLSWSSDRASLAAGDFAAHGQDELLVRSASATGSARCCQLVAFGHGLKPSRVKQRWSADYLGVDWRPATHKAVIGDFNGDAHADILLQPRYAGGDVDIVLTDEHGRVARLSDHWSGNRDGIDWSAQSYRLVPEPSGSGDGATILMVPQQRGLPYRRARFSARGRLAGVKRVSGPIAQAPSGDTSANPGVVTAHAAAARSVTTNTSSAPTGDTPGALGGSASVNSGAAGYSIKLVVPPGRMDMQPSLSLSYSSNGGDGHEGVGWSLGGLSAISRCPATDATDGYTAGTTFSASDRFCLDGKKLVLTSGTYGAAGSVYHTEVNGFAKVVAHGQLGKGPAYFTVTDPSGVTHTYGDVATATLAGPGGTVFSWAETRAQDLDGNRIVYQYSKTPGQGENYVKEIDYTLGNGSPGTRRRVTFKWEKRSADGASNIVHYLAGMTLSTTKLLTHVRTWVGKREVRDYHLQYGKSPATGRPLVKWVQACAWNAAGTKHCLNPTTFQYQGERAPTFAPVTGTSLGLVDTGSYSLCQRSSFGKFWVPLDFNGDGRQDLLGVDVQKTSGKMVVRYGRQPTPGNSHLFKAPSAVSIAPPESGAMDLNLNEPIDFDLDGRTDFTFTEQSKPDFYLQHEVAPQGVAPKYDQRDSGVPVPTNGSGSVQMPFRSPLVGDVDGDGRSDMVIGWDPTTTSTTLQAYTGQTLDGHASPFTKGRSVTTGHKIVSARPIDYDADGRTDFLIRYHKGTRYRLLLSTDGAFSKNVQTNVPAVDSPDTQGVNETPVGKVPVFTADVNGDSLPDLIEAKKNGSGVWDWFVYINKGSPDGSFKAEDSGIPVNGAVGQLRTLRDPDGREDLVVPVTRTFTAPTLVAEGCQDGGYCPPGWPDPVNSICKNARQDQTDSNSDGYDWKVYRSEGPGSEPSFTPLAFTASNLKATPHLVMDVNADGLPDIVGIYPRMPTGTANTPRKNLIEGYELSYGAKDPVPDLLHQAVNGVGVKSTWTYKPMSDSSVGTRTGASSYPEMLFKSPMQVVASLTQDNAAGGVNKTAYHYTNPHYNVAGRGFMGFGKVTQHNRPESPAQATTTVTDYQEKEPFPLFGRQISKKTKTAAGAVFEVTTRHWAPPGSKATGTADRYLVYADHTTLVEADPTSTSGPHDGSTGSLTLIRRTDTSQGGVDWCGNAVTTDRDTHTTEGIEEDVATTTHYNGGNGDPCWRETPQDKTVTTTVTDSDSPSTTDKLTVATSFDYGAKPWQLIGKNVTATRGSSVTKHFTYAYDRFGNRTQTSRSDSQAGLSRSTTSKYGSDGYFPRTVTKTGTNAVAEHSTLVFSTAVGKKTSVTGPNGCTTTYTYGPFGRKAGGTPCGASAVSINRINPGGTFGPNGATAVCDSTRAVYVQTRTQPGYPSSYICYDAFGDKLRSATRGFAGNSWVDVDRAYDPLGRVLTRAGPYYASGAKAHVTHYRNYDVLDRPAGKTKPGGLVLAFAYAGLETSTTAHDPASGATHVYTHAWDGLGKGKGHLVRVHDGVGTVTYRYDAGGDLIRATDPKGNAIRASYDGFGDKLTLSDPDKGDWSYGYDTLGDMTAVTNARGKTITYHYDGLGRKIEVDDPADSRVSLFTYDTATHGIGSPATRTLKKNGAVVHARRYAYDAAGRPVGTETSVGGRTYLAGKHYDSDGRPAGKSYPAVGGNPDQPPKVAMSGDLGKYVRPGTTVSVDAGGSTDRDGPAPLTYHWKLASGPDQVPLRGVGAAKVTAVLDEVGTYTFQVTVTDGLKSTTADAHISVKMPPPKPDPPDVSPSTSYNGDYTVAWQAVSGAGSYELRASRDGNSWSRPFRPGGGLSWSASGKSAGSYAYEVRACNEVCSGWSKSTAVHVSTPADGGIPALSERPSYDGDYTVSWGAIVGTGSYELWESKDGGAWRRVYHGAKRSWQASGKGVGHYNYKVRRCSTVGCGSYGDTVAERVKLPAGGSYPSFSKNPTYSGHFKVSWGAITGAHEYEVWRSKNGGGWSRVYRGQSQSWWENVNSPGNYHYRVRGCTRVGCGGYGSSATEVAVLTSRGFTPRTWPNPSYTGTIHVTWGALTGASRYQLQESKNGHAWNTVHNADDQSWLTSGRGVGHYRYRVRGCDGVGCGAWSDTTNETVAAPPAPDSLSVSPKPSPRGRFSVGWTNLGPADSYRLQERIGSGGWHGVYSGSNHFWSTSGRGNGTYRYRVRSCNKYTGCGPWSGSVTEHVYLPPGSPSLSPSMKSVTTGHSYTLSWTRPGGEITRYELETVTGSNSFSGVTPHSVGTSRSESYTAPSTSVLRDIYYRVRACNHSVCGGWSNTSHILDTPTSSGGGGCTRLCVNPYALQTTSPSGSGGGPGPAQNGSNAPSGGGAVTAMSTTASTATSSDRSGPLTVNYHYTATGYPDRVSRASDGHVYATIGGMDPYGHVTRLTDGNGVQILRGYSATTGLAQGVNAAAGGPALVDVTNDTWDGFGNLRQRTNHVQGYTETDAYDSVNRLESTTLAYTDGTASATTSYAYDKTGNLTSRSDVGSLLYEKVRGAGPHGVTEAGGQTLSYDGDGNVTDDRGRELHWSAFDKATSITKGNTTVSLDYGPDRSRYRKTVDTGTASTSETVTYLGDAERLVIGGQTSIRRTITLGGTMAAIDTGGANAKVLYPVTDHLGSPVAHTDANGDVTDRIGYGSFGLKMTPDRTGWLGYGQMLAINERDDDKGYTGQEGLDAVGLDDYNARLYDPKVGRFLSVDPKIGHPESTQGINPYSYVENNPLNKTDPTGEASVSGPCGGTASHLCNDGSQGTVQGPREAQDAIQKAVKGGAISPAQGKTLSKVFSQGARTMSGLGSAIGWAKAEANMQNAFADSAQQVASWTSPNGGFDINRHQSRRGVAGTVVVPHFETAADKAVRALNAEGVNNDPAVLQGEAKGIAGTHAFQVASAGRAAANGPIRLAAWQVRQIGIGEISNAIGSYTAQGVLFLATGGDSLVFEGSATLVQGGSEIGVRAIRWGAENSTTIGRVCTLCISLGAMQRTITGRVIIQPTEDAAVKMEQMRAMSSDIETDSARRALETALRQP